MSAAAAPKIDDAPEAQPPEALTPEALLALVRSASGTFRRNEALPGAGEGPRSFTPRAVAVEEVPEASAPPAPAELPVEPDTAVPAQDTAAKPVFTPAPAPETFDIEAERSAAWAEGHAAAMAGLDAAVAEARATALEEARQEAAREAEEARDIFVGAVQRITMAEHDMTEGLTAKLEQTVRQLAAERAGQRIDEAPRPFLRRIEKMTREIAAGAASTRIMMNPADIIAIKPHIKGFSPLAKAALSPDPALGRGDLRIRMDDITFSDVMAPREGGGLG